VKFYKYFSHFTSISLMLKLPIPQESLHSTSLEYILQGMQEKWKDCFSFHENQVSGMNYKLVNDETLRRMGFDMILNARPHNWKGVKGLKMNFGTYGNITDEGLELLAIGLARQKSDLNKLELNFSWCIQLTSQSLKVLGRQIGKNLYDLKVLKLDFTRVNLISEDGLQSLMANLRGLSQLEKLKLNFTGCGHTTDKNLKLLGSVISRNLTKLQELALFFNEVVEN